MDLMVLEGLGFHPPSGHGVCTLLARYLLTSSSSLFKYLSRYKH